MTVSTVVIVSASSREAAHEYGLTLTEQQVANLGLSKGSYDYPCTVELRASGTETAVTHYLLHTWATPDELKFLKSYPGHLMVSVDVETELEPKAHLSQILAAWGLERVPQPEP